MQSIVNEYSLMRKMKGCANIVDCDDVRFVQHEDGLGWNVYIKMELLTPLADALPQDVPEETVIHIAADLCRALELCRRYDIIHRDIKPQNIFVSQFQDYKLGDFGIAKTVEKTCGGTKIGTYKYMAPEVYKSQPYGAAADQYSLGMVLYWLLNERRLPFLPLPPARMTASLEEQARQRRFSGEPLPAPAHGSPELQAIVLRACAYDPKDRFASAADMLAALRALPQPGRCVSPALPAEEPDDDATVSVFGGHARYAAHPAQPEQAPQREEPPQEPPQEIEAQPDPAERTTGHTAPAPWQEKPAEPEESENARDDETPPTQEPQREEEKPERNAVVARTILIVVLALVLILIFLQVIGVRLPGSSASGKPRTTAPTGGEVLASEEPDKAAVISVALIQCSGPLHDGGYNQAAWSGITSFCHSVGESCRAYQPMGEDSWAQVVSIKQAIGDGYNVLVLPGYSLARALVETCEQYPEVYFIGLDISEADLQFAATQGEGDWWEIPQNVVCATFPEEQAGYLAGYAAVADGYTKLGFLGGMAGVGAIVNYGYGFVQGADAAAAEYGRTDVEVTFGYANQYYSSPELTAAVSNWYANGTEAVFACGGTLWQSVGEAAQAYDGKVIGVDFDQRETIDGAYGEGRTLTSAMKDLGNTLANLLSDIYYDDWADIGGRELEYNFVELPRGSSWKFSNFTMEEYDTVYLELENGIRSCVIDVENQPAVSAITVNDVTVTE